MIPESGQKAAILDKEAFQLSYMSGHVHVGLNMGMLFSNTAPSFSSLKLALVLDDLHVMFDAQKELNPRGHFARLKE